MPERARELRGKGMTLPEIAQALGVNQRTVSRYLKHGQHDMVTA
jgi:predicted transcriptional regulator